MELRVLVGHQFFAAAPYEVLATTHDQLAADAVPLVLGLPVLRIAEGQQFLKSGTGRSTFGAFNAVGQVEGVGARGLIRIVLREEQVVEAGAVRAPFAHQAVRNGVLLQSCGLAQALHHDLLAHPDPEAAGDDLVEHEELHARQSGPSGFHAQCLLRFVLVFQVLHVVHPFGEALGDGPFQLRDVRHRLREVAHHVVAGLEQPIGYAADLGRPLPQLCAGDGPFRPTTAEQRDGPELVGVRRFAEIHGQRIHLGDCAGGGIQFVEQLGGALHAKGNSGAQRSAKNVQWSIFNLQHSTQMPAGRWMLRPHATLIFARGINALGKDRDQLATFLGQPLMVHVCGKHQS